MGPFAPLLTGLGAHWSWLLGAVGFVALIAYAATSLRSVHSDVLKPVVAHARRLSRRDRDRLDSELADLRRQVDYLTGEVAQLRTSDQIYWAWIVYDQKWHRQLELDAAAGGHEIPRHESFYEFRERWKREHRETADE
ncbi:hypothetical protein E2F47_06115 [Mycobacterium eburneum]|nr:hypothetical protein [Mycobacterium eburneum]TDH56702.1 hypothetical protein E2F47_06115 [Mycobacterium eburneum]